MLSIYSSSPLEAECVSESLHMYEEGEEDEEEEEMGQKSRAS